MRDDAPSRNGFPDEQGNGLAPFLKPLLMLTSIFFLNFISRIIQAPLMPIIEAQLHLSHGGAGSLFLTISIGYFITLVGSSFICAYISHKRMILLSISLLGVALLATSVSTGLWGLRISLLGLGMAAGLYLPSGIATLTHLIESRHWGKAIAIHEIAPNLSFVAAPLVAEVILAAFSWRLAFAVLGAAALGLAAIYFRFGQGGEFRGEAPSILSFKKMVGRPSFWIMVVLFGLGISGTLGIFTMLPLYLITDHGIDRNWANTLISLSRLSGLVMALVGGWAVDRFGTRQVLKAVLSLNGLVILGLALAGGNWVLLFVFVQPMIAVCFFPAGLSALSRVSPPNQRNVAVSLVSPLGFLIGGGMVPTAIGISGDVASFSAGIFIVGAMMMLGALLPGFLRYYDQRRSE
jgi:NNP family nitrate/nitrite transporter-like MFS transporter